MSLFELIEYNEHAQYYGKPFVFRATYFEEWCNKKLYRRGFACATIIAKVSDGKVRFKFYGVPAIQMDDVCTLPMIDETDILEDRVQYGRLPEYLPNNLSSSTPIVCNIFVNNPSGDMNCIRFAMMAPLRIVEFYGSFDE